MKKYLRIVVALMSLSFALIGSIFITPPKEALAYTTFNNHVLNGGVGDWGNYRRYYFITSSGEGYRYLIGPAMDSWVNTTERTGISTPISFRETTYQPDSVIDIYAGQYYDPSTGIIAETQMFLYSTKVDPWSQNWGWTKMLINWPVMNTLSQYNQQGSIAHEMGHSMGLAHVLNTGAVMCQLGSGRTVNMPWSDDLNGINWLY